MKLSSVRLPNTYSEKLKTQNTLSITCHHLLKWPTVKWYAKISIQINFQWTKLLTSIIMDDNLQHIQGQ